MSTPANKSVYKLHNLGLIIRNVFSVLQLILLILFIYYNVKTIKDFITHLLSFMAYLITVFILFWIQINVKIAWFIYALKNTIYTKEFLEECRNSKLINEENRILRQGKYHSFYKYDYIDTLIKELIIKYEQREIEKLQHKDTLLKDTLIYVFYDKTYFYKIFIMLVFYIVMLVSTLLEKVNVSYRIIVSLIVTVGMVFYLRKLLTNEMKYIKNPYLIISHTGMMINELGTHEILWKEVEINFLKDSNNKDLVVFIFNSRSITIDWEQKLNFNIQEFKRIVSYYKEDLT